jgi:hypothetical protein
MVVFSAYYEIYHRATELKCCYDAYVPGDDQGYQPSSRHLILTGVSGIGKQDVHLLPIGCTNAFIGKSFAQSVIFFEHLAARIATACQPF